MSQEPLLQLLLIPLLVSALAFCSRWAGALARVTVATVHALGLLALAANTLSVVSRVIGQGAQLGLNGWLHVDQPGAIFVGLIGVVGCLVGFHAIGYMNHELEEGKLDGGRLCGFYAIFNLFVFTMLLAATANNIIMMWVAIEATTLGSVFLVGFYGRRTSLEAAWKYIVICTAGVAFGLYGVVLAYSNAVAAAGLGGDASFWTVLRDHAASLDPRLAKLSFVFVLIGFGTKVGLFPMHAWLPDAHSEAPSPISALLSAVLLNCAMLIVLRFHILTVQAVGASFSQTLLMVFGVLSLAMAAFFIVVQRDIKRLLAYSSMENMGLIALAFGIGGPLGVLAGLLHTINHSLAKALLFCTSGNLLMKYGSSGMDVVKGVLKAAPLTGVIFVAGALAIGGVPPFNIFVSEFMIVVAGLKAGHAVLIVVCLLLLTVVLGGLVRMLAATVFGDAPAGVAKGDAGVLTLLPLLLLLVAMLIMGVQAPAPVMNLLDSAANVVLRDAPAPGTPPAARVLAPQTPAPAAAR